MGNISRLFIPVTLANIIQKSMVTSLVAIIFTSDGEKKDTMIRRNRTENQSFLMTKERKTSLETRVVEDTLRILARSWNERLAQGGISQVKTWDVRLSRSRWLPSVCDKEVCGRLCFMRTTRHIQKVFENFELRETDLVTRPTSWKCARSQHAESRRRRKWTGVESLSRHRPTRRKTVECATTQSCRQTLLTEFNNCLVSELSTGNKIQID